MNNRHLGVLVMSACVVAAAAVAAFPSAQAHASSGAHHTVRRGGVSWRIAASFHMSVAAIARQNHISNPNLIYTARCLTLPPRRHSCYQRIRPGASAAPTTGSANVPVGNVGALLPQSANDHGVSPALVKAVAQAESGWTQGARSYSGAIGLMRLMPGTAAMLNVSHGTGYNVWSASGNAELGAMYLRDLLNRYGGCTECAISAYNQGPYGYERHGMSNWSWYVAPVLAAMRRYKHA
jgi:soluble lytic murein transglycosylase-like protein